MRATPRSRSLGSLTTLLLLAAACGSDNDRTLRIIKGAAIKEGVVTGFVVDDLTEVPVRAEVLVGGTPVRAQADGSFEAPATAGRVRVEVRSEGYLKTFRDVAVGGRSLPMPFKVAKRAPKQVVGPAGGKFTYSEATLEVPAGAFATDTGLSLTHLNRVRVAAIAAQPQFIDEQGIPRRAVALVDLTADQQPSMAVRARVPVPGDATMDSVSGFVVDGSGNWTTAITPDVVSGGFAEFVLTGDLQIGVAVDVRRADGRRLGYLVADKGGSGSAQGDVLSSAEITAGTRAAAIVDPQGSRVELATGTRVRVEVPMETGTPTRAPYAGEVAVTAGRARVVVTPPAADAPKLIKLTIKGNAGKFDVKGTAFSVSTCGFPPNVVDVLEVGEGLVAATAGTENKDVAAGETATVCTDCSAATVAMCTPPEDDGGAPAPAADGSSPVSPDAGAASEGGTGAGSDAGASPGPDAAAGSTDAPAVGTDGAAGTPDAAVVVQPDAAPTPDTAIKPDTAAPTPDTAPPTPDTAAPTPDTAAPTPDAAVIEPDAAPLMPDTAPPPADAAAPSLDMAFDSASIPIDASLARFVITPDPQDFGPVTIGMTSAAVNFTVTNKGDLPSDTPSVNTTGDFSVSTNGCINPVPSNTSCVVGVTFKPTVAGARTGLLRVITSDGTTFAASLLGSGVSPVPAQFAIKPLSHNFGYKQMGRATGDVIFTLSNTGGQAAGVPKIGFGGPNAADFAFSLGAPRNGYCPNPLPPGGSCTISLHFAPKTVTDASGVQAKTATLVIDGNPGGQVNASLQGTATLAENGLEIEPPHIDLGPVAVGAASPMQTFVVRNIGTMALRSLTFTASTPHAIALQEWNFNTQDCPATLDPPGGLKSSCNVIVYYIHRTPVGLRQLEWQAHAQPIQLPNITANAAAHVQATPQ